MYICEIYWIIERRVSILYWFLINSNKSNNKKNSPPALPFFTQPIPEFCHYRQNLATDSTRRKRAYGKWPLLYVRVKAVLVCVFVRVFVCHVLGMCGGGQVKIHCRIRPIAYVKKRSAHIIKLILTCDRVCAIVG